MLERRGLFFFLFHLPNSDTYEDAVIILHSFLHDHNYVYIHILSCQLIQPMKSKKTKKNIKKSLLFKKKKEQKKKMASRTCKFKCFS